MTLDAPLQRAAERLLTEAAPEGGAVVVLDTRTGRVLVWAERVPRGKPAGTVLLDTRAPAASVFKLVTTAALLERAGIDPSQVVCYAGGRYGIERKHLERPRGEPARCAPFADALGHSRNAVFAQLTTRFLTRQDLIEVAQGFGFDKDVPFDAKVPLGTLDVPYSDLDVARTATGFRGNNLSVLGAAQISATIAAGGETLRLQIVREAEDYAASAERHVVARALKARTARQLTRMMEVTVHSGTSRVAFTAPSGMSYLGAVRVAGKTGTLQPSDPTRTTSWFTGFAPSRSPEIAIAVLLQNGKVWRRKANEVARDILREYFASKGTPLVTSPFAATTEGLAARR